MNEQLRESLSALMDDEAEPLEVRRVLKAMEEDPGLLAAWQRMQVTSNAMRNELPYTGGGEQYISIASRVSMALQDEPALEFNEALTAGNSTVVKPKVFARPLASLAMAATVAAVTVVGVLQYQRFNNSAVPAGIAANVAVNDVADSGIRVAAAPGFTTRGINDGLSRPVSASFEQASPQQRLSLAKSIHQVQAGKAAAQQRLFGYMQRHAEHAALNNNQGIMPMARVVNASQVQY